MCKKVMKARKIRLYSNKKQKEFFEKCFRFSINAWNQCKELWDSSMTLSTCMIHEKSFYYRNYGVKITQNKNEY